MENEKRYSVIELAELLDVPRTTINDWLAKYSMYIDFTLQGKRRAYTERALTVLKEISELRNSGISSIEIEQELAKRHPVQAEPAETPSNSALSSEKHPEEKQTVPILPEGAPKENQTRKSAEMALVTKRHTDDLGKAIGESFQNMAVRLEDIEQMAHAQAGRTKIWITISLVAFLILLIGAFFSYRQIKLTVKANKELKEDTAFTNNQLQMLHRQSIALIAGNKAFKENIELLEKEMKTQKELFDQNLNTIRLQMEEARKMELNAEKEKNAAILKVKEAELALEKEKFAAERLKLLRDIEKMNAEKEKIAGDLKKQMESQRKK